MIDYITGYRVPALQASRLIKTIATTPLRAWLFHIGPSGLSVRNRGRRIPRLTITFAANDTCSELPKLDLFRVGQCAQAGVIARL
jgi:hypothetical protein